MDHREPDMVAHSCNHSPWRLRQEDGEFQDGLDCEVRCAVKKNRNKNKMDARPQHKRQKCKASRKQQIIFET
jgi:hypothetical protein